LTVQYHPAHYASRDLRGTSKQQKIGLKYIKTLLDQAVVLGRYTRRYLETHGVERIAETESARFESAARLLSELATASAGP
jgi:uroporphyrinogen-III synthase